MGVIKDVAGSPIEKLKQTTFKEIHNYFDMCD